MAENYFHNGWTPEKSPAFKKPIIIIIIMAVAAVLIIVFLIYLAASLGKGSGHSAVKNKTTALNNQAVSKVTANSVNRQVAEKANRPSFGNPQAKLVIVEFADFQCPYSEAEFPLIRSIMNARPKDIFFIYRHYPVINDFSINLAQAAMCAQDQGKFWQIHDKLFLNRGGFADRSSLSQLTSVVGLDAKQFDSCLDSEKDKNLVLEDARDATLLGVAGTPTFFVNGYKVEGVVTKEQWETIISKALELLK